MTTAELIQQLSFDYDSLNIETSDVEAIKVRTWEIKDIARRTAEGMIQIGQALIEVKEMLPHGQFLPWIDAEFGWGDRTARNFMRVAEVFSNRKHTSDLKIGFQVLALLSAPSTPEEIREELIKRAASGETITQSTAKDAIAAARPTFQIGVWVSGIYHKASGVIEGEVAQIGNKYLVLKCGKNVLIASATILEPATPTLMDAEEEAMNSDLAPIQTPETIETSLPTSRIEKGQTEFKPGDIVAGFYNPTNQYEVGELESYSSLGYSLLVTADDRRCGVVTDTLRDVTSEEEEAFYYELGDELPAEPKPDPTPEPAPSKMDVHYSSESVEHYTPRHITASVIAVLGKIVLDPCSNSHHSPSVPSVMRYTKADDGLAHTWLCKTLYMNPPYGDEISAWVDKLCVEYEAGNVEEAIALIPSRTDTKWFDTLSYAASCICFVKGRLKFGDAKNSAPFPSAIAYLGQNFTKFRDVFNQHGSIWIRLDDVDGADGVD